MTGIYGIGAGGPATSPPPGVGVYGQGGAGDADGVQGVGSGRYCGVKGFGGPNGGTGVVGQGGANGGYPIVAVNYPGDIPVYMMRGQIHMVPLPLTEDPNSAGVPGTLGDLLAVDINGAAQLWFYTGNATGNWTLVLGV